MADAADPLARFRDLFERAKGREGADPTAVALATADATGRPSVRFVLLKAVDERGFVFYTNYESPKARDLADNPRAALCFHWPALAAQVRVEGRAERVASVEADAYFATRPRESQLAAWASRQSAPLASREELLARYAQIEERLKGCRPPRPEFWGGFRVVPDRVEFWTSDDRRLHHRTLYLREGTGWRRTLLSP